MPVVHATPTGYAYPTGIGLGDRFPVASGGPGPEPYHHRRIGQPIVPGDVYELRIGLTPRAHCCATGSRIRLELCCAESTITDLKLAYAYTPDMVGTDSFHHDAVHSSRLLLPVLAGRID